MRNLIVFSTVAFCMCLISIFVFFNKNKRSKDSLSILSEEGVEFVIHNGKPYEANLMGLDLNSMQLDLFENLKELRRIDFSNSNLDDTHLTHFSKLNRLNSVVINNTNVSPDALVSWATKSGINQVEALDVILSENNQHELTRYGVDVLTWNSSNSEL